ncbi:DNA polymerase III subunit delta [Paenibacillus psychroresistens]|uniref:DNA polymerase III subunit delta n=1 Tax=Paenibacillus psychroresistens TaxID=1778678 RepID=A0A6B8RIX2_9BACL|nr:DNA polymerase III subunit delta [Paenibacillus psychroresistens]QGQ95694.1 DNA polymerase III subunit delta [Paenibacillus psychroresistens]
MDYKTAAKGITQGNSLPIYVCYGTEKYLQQEFIQHVIDKLIEPDQRSFAVSRYDLSETSLDTVLDDAETMPFLADKKIVIAKNALFFTGAKESTKVEHRIERLLEYLKSPVDYAIIIFVVDADKLDERKKIVKALKESQSAIPFLPLSVDELSRWISRRADKWGVTFEDGAIDKFILYTGAQLQILTSELEKLSLFVGPNGCITGELIGQLVVRSAEQNVFILMDEIVKQRLDNALSIFHDLLKQKEEPIKILLLIARQFRIMLQIKELEQQGYSQQQIAGQIGAHPYAVKLASEQGRSYSLAKLSGLLSQLGDLDYRMKSGKVEKALGLELFILEIPS